MTTKNQFLFRQITVLGFWLLVFASACKKEEKKDTQLPPHEISVSLGESVVDIDGNVYATVIIGDQQWTAENLKTTRYANGDLLIYTEDEETWNELLFSILNHGAWCYYDNDSTHNKIYGKLYNWPAAEDSRNICPNGWRVPSDEDWHKLAKHLDPDAKLDSVAPNPFSPNIKTRINGVESKVAGGYLKATGNSSASTGLWDEPNKGATNKALFNAKPAGARLTTGNGGTRFQEMGRGAAFWTTTKGPDLPPPGSLFRILSFDFPYLEQRKIFPSSGMSIRCIKN
jgi:uncharacterized protein (TIGR02145 family)